MDQEIYLDSETRLTDDVGVYVLCTFYILISFVCKLVSSFLQICCFILFFTGQLNAVEFSSADVK